MKEFEIIKEEMRTMINLDPTIQDHYKNVYIEQLEKCSKFEDITDNLKKYIKMVYVEMKEEQEELELYEKENEVYNVKLSDSINSLNELINNPEKINELNVDESVNTDELFSYIKDGKVEVPKKSNTVQKLYDWKRDLRNKTSRILGDLYDQLYGVDYVIEEHPEDLEQVNQDVLKLKDSLINYHIYRGIELNEYNLLREKVNKNIISLQQHEIIDLLGYGISNDYDTIKMYISNGILSRLLVRLYTYLYKLDENDELDKEKVKNYLSKGDNSLENLIDSFLNNEINANEFEVILKNDIFNVEDRRIFDPCVFKLSRKYKEVLGVNEAAVSASMTFLAERKNLLVAFAKAIENKKSHEYYCTTYFNDMMVNF